MSDELVADRWTLGGILHTTIPVLLALSVLSMGSGLVLERMKHLFLSYPALLILFPVMIGLGGTLGSLLASRLSTAVYLGTATVSFRDRAMLANILAVVGLAATASIVAGLGAGAASRFLPGAVLPLSTLVVVALMSSMVLVGFVIVTVMAVTAAAYRFRIDPDDVAIPVVTNTADIVGAVTYTAVVLLVVSP